MHKNELITSYKKNWNIGSVHLFLSCERFSESYRRVRSYVRTSILNPPNLLVRSLVDYPESNVQLWIINNWIIQSLYFQFIAAYYQQCTETPNH